MSLRARKPGSLATQISLSTLGLVALSVLVASVLALGGVYNLARQESAARLQAFRDILLEDLSARFVVADLVVESAVANTEAAEDEDEVRESFYRLASANTEYFDVMILADRDGEVVSAWPPAAAPTDFSAEPYLADAPDARGRIYTWDVAEDSSDGSGRVWVAQVVPESGEVAAVAARLRVGFIGLLIDEITSGDDRRVALVVDAAGEIVESGDAGPSLDLAGADWSASDEDAHSGSVVAEHPSLGAFDGYYAEVRPGGGLGWRVVVLEPRSVAVSRTQDALLPASLTVLAAVLVAMWVAFVFGRRLAQPLRLLEARAREVASGAYIQPIELEREDEVGRLASAFNAMAARLNALQDLSQLLASASELDQVLDSILSAMEHILGTGRSAIFLVDGEGHRLQLVKASGSRVRSPDLSVPVAGPSWVSQAFRTGRAVSFIMSPDDATADPVVGLFSTDDASSGLAVPLSIGYRPFGVVLVVSSGRRRFSDAETEMARAFSAQAAIAVQNSRLFEEEHLSRMEAESLREMAELLAGPKGLEETLHEVGDIAAELLGMSRAYLAMPERDRRDLEAGPPEDPETDRRYLEMWGEVTASHPEREAAEPVPLETLRHDPLYADLSRSRGVESVIMIPMVQGARDRGVLVLESDDHSRQFSQRDVEVAYATGKTVSVALETNFLFNQARRRAENLEMVFRISQAVSLSLQTTVVLNRVMDVVQKMVPSTGVSLMQYDRRHEVLSTAMVRGVEDKRVLLASVEPGEDIPGEAFDSRSPVNIRDLEQVDTPLAQLLFAQGFKSWLCAPLLARGRSIGVLSVYSRDLSAFSEEDAELVATFAAQAALALDTAEMFEREHTVASVLQSSILPDVLPRIQWFDTASTYQPAGSESDIGGDYYDLLVAPNGNTVLAIGDVCGKGVKAATKTSIIKYTLRGLVAAGLGPAEALTELNRVVAETGDIADIVTMWVGSFDPAHCRLAYADAGHPPALIRDPGGSVSALGPTGPLLGALAEAEFDQNEVTVEPGAIIALYTDGVTEARGREGLFGEQRLTEAVAASTSAQDAIDRIVAAVRGFTKGLLRDDVAMLVVQFDPDSNCGVARDEGSS